MSTNGEDCDSLSVDLKNVERRQSVISLGEVKVNEVSWTAIFSLTRMFSWRGIFSFTGIFSWTAIFSLTGIFSRRGIFSSSFIKPKSRLAHFFGL